MGSDPSLQCTDLLVSSFWIRYWFWCDVAFCLFSDIWCFLTLRLTLLRSWFWRCFTVSKAILERWWSDSYWNKNENKGNRHTYAFYKTQTPTLCSRSTYLIIPTLLVALHVSDDINATIIFIWLLWVMFCNNHIEHCKLEGWVEPLEDVPRVQHV